jgi:predicted alpha/beta-fold hydrolase
LGGCFSERSFPARLEAVVRVEPPREVQTVRAWTAAAAKQLQPLLPANHVPALTTDELIGDDGKPIDVYAHFRTNPARLSSVFQNFYGLMHTVQCSHTTVPERDPPDWPEFEDVWIPVADGVRVFGRIGFATRDGTRLKADCIVILPGLLGDLSVDRTRVIAQALRASGHHALAVELRGYGRTSREQPDVYYNFGVQETEDLRTIAEWAQARPEVDRTGLIGFCWGANHVLLAAWDEGRSPDHVSIAPRLKPHLRTANDAPGGSFALAATGAAVGTNGHAGAGACEPRHFAAGVIAFSPVLAFEEIIERTQTPTSVLVDPVLNTLQDGIRERQLEKGHLPVDGNLRTLIDAEFARSSLRYPGAVEDGLDYLRFVPFGGREAGDKLGSARVPVLIVHGSTDPLASAQAVAECVARTRNSNVAVIMTEGGGHVGFASYARDWFYSVILGFFDREHGAAATVNGNAVKRASSGSAR